MVTEVKTEIVLGHVIDIMILVHTSPVPLESDPAHKIPRLRKIYHTKETRAVLQALTRLK